LAWIAAALVASACAPTTPTATAPPSGAPAASSAAAAAGQPAAGSELSPEVRRLIQAARDSGETELNVAWASSSLGGMESIKRIEAWMNQTYGTNIKITLIPGPSMTDMVGKITQEYLAGQKASSDVYLGRELHLATMLPHDVLEQYDYTQLSPRITRDIVGERNVGVEVYTTIPAILYNSELVPRAEVPQRLEDVLQPKWRGRIAATETASYFGSLSAHPEWGAERMKAYMARLSQQVGGLIRNSEEHRIISGEFVMLVLGNTHNAKQNSAKGAPLASVVPEDVAQANTLNLGVPRNSAHPNLAKLYINAMLSEAGQRILFETYLTDHSELPGSRSAEDLAELRAKGIRLQKLNVRFALDHPDLPEVEQELRTILRGR
jgi:ABC-type Fe3+ transport system substrate-binding protein